MRSTASLRQKLLGRQAPFKRASMAFARWIRMVQSTPVAGTTISVWRALARRELLD